LRHPGIVVLYQVGEWRGQMFLVLELVQGVSLTERLTQGPALVAEVIDWGIQIADALAHAHAEGIVHRDLKPANVILQPNGRLKVLDFGIAAIDLGQAELLNASGRDASALAWEHGRTLGGAGSPAYMAPEQWAGHADARTDLFALGVILAEALCGARPFPAPRVFERTPLPDDAPADLAADLDALLADPPAARHTAPQPG
jgi:serine/threonine protein kinase